MTVSPLRSALLALVACAAGCGESAEGPHIVVPPPDAGTPDGRPEAPPDAPPDGPPVIDQDHDGHPADADCDDTNPAVWRNVAYFFRDADGDGHTVASVGSVCTGDSLPPGYLLSPGDPDCNDADPAEFTAVTGFLDIDGDGFGDATTMTTFCTAGALPANYAPAGGDCAIEDAARWQSLAYSFRDIDGDGAAVPEVGTVCSGAALPASYLASAPGGVPPDCDDANPEVSIALQVFVDADHDGFGTGPVQTACTSGAPPDGFAIKDGDCDDADPLAWVPLTYTAVDFDADGVTASALGTRCTAGVLLPPYYATPMGDDCNDADATVSIALTVFVDGDGDGFGAGPSQVACTSGAPPEGFATTGTDCDDVEPAIWKQLAYAAIDGDGDGATVTQSGVVCTDGTLPPPFKATPSGNDCNDDDPLLTHFAVLYADGDGDGVGAPPRQVSCIGSALPAGLVRGGYDDDDADPAVIEADDDELDLLLLGD